MVLTFIPDFDLVYSCRQDDVLIQTCVFFQVLGDQQPPGGIQFAVQFPDGPDGPVDDVAVAARAREAGLAILPLSIWYTNSHTRQTPRGLVIGFANIVDAAEAHRHAHTLRACLDR